MKQFIETKFNIEVPFFPGFYGSMLDTDYSYTEEYEYMQEHYDGFEIEDEDINFDYDAYKKNVGEDFVNAIMEIMPTDMVKSMEYESIYSPRYYNFSNDRLFANIEMQDDWLEKMTSFIELHKTWFISRLRDDWSSRDGFHSFMANTLPEWLKMLQEGDTRYIGTTLGYIIELSQPFQNGESIEWNLCETALENNYPGMFMALTEDAEKRYQEFKAERDEQERIKALNDKLQTKIEFKED